MLSAIFPDLEPGEILQGKFRQTIFRLAWPMARADSFEPAYSLSAALSGHDVSVEMAGISVNPDSQHPTGAVH